MAIVVCCHSFRGGTGKSNLVANLSGILAQGGKRIGVIDTDIQSPGIHCLFGLDNRTIGRALNDYLQGECDIRECVYDVTPSLGASVEGRVFLTPASVKTHEITRVLREGYDIGLLNHGFRTLIQQFGLDVLLIDTHPGLNEETLLSIAISDMLIIIMRLDQQDYLGTGVTLEVARQLDAPHIALVVNKVPSIFDPVEVTEQISQTYGCQVAAVLPYSSEMMVLGSAGIFALRYPDHVLSQRIQDVVRLIMVPGGAR